MKSIGMTITMRYTIFLFAFLCISANSFAYGHLVGVAVFDRIIEFSVPDAFLGFKKSDYDDSENGNAILFSVSNGETDEIWQQKITILGSSNYHQESLNQKTDSLISSHRHGCGNDFRYAIIDTQKNNVLAILVGCTILNRYTETLQLILDSNPLSFSISWDEQGSPVEKLDTAKWANRLNSLGNIVICESIHSRNGLCQNNAQPIVPGDTPQAPRP